MNLGTLIWIMLGTALAGVAMIVIVSVPEFADQAATLIPLGCGAAIILAIPLALLISKRIRAQTRGV